MLQLVLEGGEPTVDLAEGRITVGREGENTLVLDSGDVSGFHAEIHCDRAGVFLVDLGSTNGTRVNDQPVLARRKLEPWDIVHFGSTKAEVVDTEGRRPTQLMQAVGAAGPGIAGPGAAVPAEPWHLVGLQGELVVTGQHVVGRDAASDFVLSSAGVSRRHAQLELSRGRLLVKDLGSSNGTFVNGERIQEQALRAGDEVKFDVEPFRVEGPPDAGPTSVRPAVGAGAAGAPTRTIKLPTARLEVASGMDAKSFELAKDKYIVGRSARCDISLPVDSVSARHAELERTSGGWRLTDLRSTNGTYVNGSRVETAELKTGDEVRFGEVQLKLAVPLAPGAGTREMPGVGETVEMDSVARSSRPVPPWAWAAGAAGLATVAALLFFLLRGSSPCPECDGPLQARVLWTVETEESGGVIGTPALGLLNEDDYLDVAIPSASGYVTVVDGEEGKVVYEQQVPEGIFASAATGRLTQEGSAGTVVSTNVGAVYAIGGDGQFLWSSEDDLDLGGIINKPLLIEVNGDQVQDVVAPTEKQGLVALDGFRGWKLWDTRVMVEGRMYGAPVSGDVNRDGVTDLVGLTDKGEVLAVSASEGNVWKQWSVSSPSGSGYASPALIDVGGRTLIVVAANGVAALEGASGRVAWRALEGRDFSFASPIALDGDGDGAEDVLVVETSGNAWVLNGQYGEEISSGSVGDRVRSTPALFDEDGDGRPEAFVLTERCELHVLDVFRMRNQMNPFALDVDGRGGVACVASPVLGDLDRDGRIDAALAMSVIGDQDRNAWLSNPVASSGVVTALAFNRQVPAGRMVWGELLGGGD